MKNQVTVRFPHLLIGLFVLALSACGGGGGASSLSYTGLTTAASIDNTNADDLPAGAVQTGSSASGTVEVQSMSQPTKTPTRVIMDTVRDVALKQDANSSATGIVVPAGVQGTCGGSDAVNGDTIS